MILFLILCTYLLHRRGYNTAAGLPLALAIAIKPTVGVVLLFFAWKRRWRVLAVAVATVVLLTGLGFCVVGWARFPDYLEVVQLWSSGALLVFPHNQSVRGLALRAFTTNAYNQPLHVVPWLGYAVPILIGLLAVGSWTASISHSDNRTESVGSVEYGLTVTSMLLVLPLVSDLHFVWVLAPISALLLVMIDNLRSINGLLLLAAGFVVAVYLGYPAVQDKTYAGHQALLYRGELVNRSKALCTGAYLYGLIALDICLVMYLNLRRAIKHRLRRPRSDRSESICKRLP